MFAKVALALLSVAGEVFRFINRRYPDDDDAANQGPACVYAARCNECGYTWSGIIDLHRARCPECGSKDLDSWFDHREDEHR